MRSTCVWCGGSLAPSETYVDEYTRFTKKCQVCSAPHCLEFLWPDIALPLPGR